MFLNVFEFDIYFPLWQAEKFAQRVTLYLEIDEKELRPLCCNWWMKWAEGDAQLCAGPY